MTKRTKENTVTISNGNMKMGYIKSVSLPPIVTCANGCTCAKECYAVKMCRLYPSVKKSYYKNLEIATNNMRDYFEQIEEIAFTQRFFRWHVSGDIPNYKYFTEMVYTAYNLADTQFLVFTKQFDIVNEYLQKSEGMLPPNLTVIFSAYHGMELKNPYNLPVSIVVDMKGKAKGKKAREKRLHKFQEIFKKQGVHLCGGNCTECLKQGIGCFYLKHGEIVALPKH